MKLENLGSGQVHEFVCKSRIEKNKDSEGVVELAVTKEEDPPKGERVGGHCFCVSLCVSV